MSATMTTHTGIDLAARRETAEHLWRQHTGGTLVGWSNPAGYTLRARVMNASRCHVGTLVILASALSYLTSSGEFSPQEQAAVRAIRAALIGGG